MRSNASVAWLRRTVVESGRCSAGQVENADPERKIGRRICMGLSCVRRNDRARSAVQSLADDDIPAKMRSRRAKRECRISVDALRQ